VLRLDSAVNQALNSLILLTALTLHAALCYVSDLTQSSSLSTQHDPLPSYVDVHTQTSPLADDGFHDATARRARRQLSSPGLYVALHEYQPFKVV